MERYKWMHPRHIKPELFTFGRILDYRINLRGDREETNTPWKYHADLLAGKDEKRLSWIGDKNPAYVRNLGRLSQNNPGAKFILTYRPLEGVAESFEARSQDPEDPWRLGGFEAGIDYWNIAMRATRDFVEGSADPNVLVLSYHDFFYRNEACVPLISHFLNLEFDDAVLGEWKRMSAGFEAERRRKRPLTGEQARFVEEHKDHAAEEWVLGRIEEQWKSLERDRAEAQEMVRARGAEPYGLALEAVKARNASGNEAARARYLERRVEELEGSLEEKTRALERLETCNARLALQVRDLDGRLEGIQASRTWRMLDGLKRFGVGALSRIRRSG